MSTERILIHGTTAQRMATTPKRGQIGSDDDTGRIVLGDDVTPGGIEHARLDDLPPASRLLPVPEEGDAGKVPVVNEAEDGYVLGEGGGGGGSATSVTYENTASGLVSNNVQGAIDQLAAASTFLAPLMRGYISGLTLSNNVTTPNTKLDVASGVVNSDDATLLMKLTAGTVDLTITGVDGLDTGSLAASTWYHVFAIGTADGSAARLASLSPVAPILPIGYTKKRRIGSFRTNASSQVTPFRQVSNKFLWLAPVNDYPVTTNPGAGAITPSLTVPSGVQVDSIIWFWLESDTNAPGRKVALITSLEQEDSAPAAGGRSSISAGSGSTGIGSTQSEFVVTTNTSRQIRFRLAPSDAGTRIAITTVGWIDHL